MQLVYFLKYFLLIQDGGGSGGGAGGDEPFANPLPPSNYKIKRQREEESTA